MAIKVQCLDGSSGLKLQGLVWPEYLSMSSTSLCHCRPCLIHACSAISSCVQSNQATGCCKASSCQLHQHIDLDTFTHKNAIPHLTWLPLSYLRSSALSQPILEHPVCVSKGLGGSTTACSLAPLFSRVVFMDHTEDTVHYSRRNNVFFCHTCRSPNLHQPDISFWEPLKTIALQAHSFTALIEDAVVFILK